MDAVLSELQQYKEKIPEFIVKLYHILEQQQYSDYLVWHNNTEVLIKNPKKLEDKVLPHFFRHKHLSSFIRQLNMYKFSKVNKVSRQKNHMYFKNENFQRGRIKQLMKIKRNAKKNRKESEEESEAHENDNKSEISLSKQLANNQALESYQFHVKKLVREIVQTLKKVENKYPDAITQLTPALNICNELLEIQDSSSFSLGNIDEINQNKNMLSTMRLLPRIESLVFPSQCSFYHLN